jgi:uncharacterized membrane protein
MRKTMSFAVVHFTVAFTVGYLMSGSVLVGGSIALVEPAVNTLAYHVHELVWKRLHRGGRYSSRRPSNGRRRSSRRNSLTPWPALGWS